MKTKGFCLACFAYKPLGKDGLLVTHKSRQGVTHAHVQPDASRGTVRN